MNFLLEKTAAKSTTKANAVSKTVRVHAGILKSIFVIIPYGSFGLVHFKLFAGEHQIFPVNPDKDFTGDDVKAAFELGYEIIPGLNKLKLVVWNDDDTFSHTVSIMATVLKKERAYPFVTFKYAMDKLLLLVKKMFGIEV